MWFTLMVKCANRSNHFVNRALYVLLDRFRSTGGSRACHPWAIYSAYRKCIVWNVLIPKLQPVVRVHLSRITFRYPRGIDLRNRLIPTFRSVVLARVLHRGLSYWRRLLLRSGNSCYSEPDTESPWFFVWDFRMPVYVLPSIANRCLSLGAVLDCLFVRKDCLCTLTPIWLEFFFVFELFQVFLLPSACLATV